MGKLKELEKRLKLYAQKKKVAWFGYKLEPEVAQDINKVDQCAYIDFWINDDTLYFWKNNWKDVYTKIEKRLVKGDQNVYSGIINEDLYPLFIEMRKTTRKVYMPVTPRTDLKDKVRLGKGLALIHFDELFPTGNFRSQPNPVNLTLLEVELDPPFDVEVIRRKGKTLTDEFGLEIGLKDLNKILRGHRESLRSRGYKKIVADVPITLNYALDSLPGRRNEMPAIPL